MSTLIVITIVLGLQLAGVILMVGMLIAPGIAARQWTHKLDQMVVLAASFGRFRGRGRSGHQRPGQRYSHRSHDHRGGIRSGLIVDHAGARARPAVEPHETARQPPPIRRAEYPARSLSLCLAPRRRDSPVPDEFIRGVGDRSAELGLRQVRAAGQAAPSEDGWRLTDTGIQEARRIARNEKLWDMYRLHAHALDLPVLEEARQAPIASVLPAAAIALLERELREAEASA